MTASRGPYNPSPSSFSTRPQESKGVFPRPVSHRRRLTRSKPGGGQQLQSDLPVGRDALLQLLHDLRRLAGVPSLKVVPLAFRGLIYDDLFRGGLG